MNADLLYDQNENKPLLLLAPCSPSASAEPDPTTGSVSSVACPLLTMARHLSSNFATRLARDVRSMSGKERMRVSETRTKNAKT